MIGKSTIVVKWFITTMESRSFRRMAMRPYALLSFYIIILIYKIIVIITAAFFCGYKS